jgi:hypothetical protein
MARRPPLDLSYMDVGRGPRKWLAWGGFALCGVAYFVVFGGLFWLAPDRLGPEKAGMAYLVFCLFSGVLFRAGMNAARRRRAARQGRSGGPV